MGELLNRVLRANAICEAAYKYFNQAEKFETMNVNLRTKKKKVIKRTLIVGGIALMIFSSALDGSTMWGIVMLMIVGVIGVYIFSRIAQLNLQIASNNKAINKEIGLGQQTLEANMSGIEFIPRDYWFPKATQYIVKVVQAGRTESLNEVLNMLDSQIHRWNVEDANQQMILQQQMQTAHLKSIRKSSKVSAAANVGNFISNASRNF